MTDKNPILLQTKLHRPPITRELISRQRLIEQLDRGIGCPLILVTAPAGFGKTTLICNWLEHMAVGRNEGATSVPGSSMPSAWLSLDKNDNDLNLFLRYVSAALRTIFNDACGETRALLDSQQQPPPAVLYATFCNELATLPEEVILVLDDYQFIRGKAVLTLLIELARHWPKPLHLVLISRIAPPLPLTDLRAKGMVNEIRTQDLRFTPQETTAYFRQAQLAPLGQSALQVLEDRFEGWPAGLHLAALSLRSASSQESVLSVFSSDNPNITGYMIDEVLTQQFPAIRSFLLKTSILDRFCASLCAAVIGESDITWNAPACLEWVYRNDLFVNALDDRHEWYRYHHLFQELLRRSLSAELGSDQVANLHRRASVWFENQGLIDDALYHALAAGDLDLAARQMYAGLPDALNRQDRPTLDRWLNLLPEEMIQQCPELLMIRCWALQFSWRLDLQAQVLRQLEELLDSGGDAALPAGNRQTLRGLVLILRVQQAYFGNQIAQAIDLSRQVLTLVPPSWKYVRGAAMLFVGTSMQASGQTADAERLLLDSYESHGDRSDIYSLYLLMGLCFCYLISGRLEQTMRMARVLIQQATRGGRPLMQYWGHWFLGVAYLQRNELVTAAQHFSQIVENRYFAQITVYRDAVAGLAMIHQIKGEDSVAWQMVESISQFDLDLSGHEDSRTRSLRARLMLMQGDMEGAGDWVNMFSDPPPNQALLWLEEPQVTRAHVLLAREADTGLRPALQVLDALNEIADRTHNTRYKTEVLAMRALALDAQGETSQAEADLKQAVELARLGGFIRVFADLGQPMQAMLRRLSNQDHSSEPIRRILDAFPEADKNLDGRNSLMRQPAVINSALPEPLTPRERQVLTLLREPIGVKEVALKLNITHATARRHTINIYGKLGVNTRWDAVARAIELGILPPD